MADADADAGAGERLDQALATRGLARSRTHAARLVDAGAVLVNGREARKSSLRVLAGDTLTVSAADHYVSRAAHKLLAGLDAFGVDPAGRVCLDVGASTGGFSQVLLERGARHVVAIDVGHGQLDGRLASDARLTMLEGLNARDLTAAGLDARLAASPQAGSPSAPRAADLDLVVADLSFISLTLVLPPLRATAAADAEFVVLVKPQFEVGRQGVREGIVTDAALVRDALERVLWCAFDAGLGTAGLIPSPIAGTHGNREFVAHLATFGKHPTEWTDRIRQLTKGARD